MHKIVKFLNGALSNRNYMNKVTLFQTLYPGAKIVLSLANKHKTNLISIVVLMADLFTLSLCNKSVPNQRLVAVRVVVGVKFGLLKCIRQYERCVSSGGRQYTHSTNGTWHASSHSQMCAVLPWEFWGRVKNSLVFQMGAFLRISVSQLVSTLELGR